MRACSITIVSLFVLLCVSLKAQATSSVILSPSAAVASSDQGSIGDIGNTIDQSGLTKTFISGVTEYDSYFAQSFLLHHPSIVDNEWISGPGDPTPTVTYDLGDIYFIDRLALWVEDAWGIESFDLYYSLDNVTFEFAFTSVPIDNPTLESYPVEQFDLNATARYIRLELTDCSANASQDLCGIGEIAFSVNVGVLDVDEDGVPDQLDVCSDTVIPEGMPTKGLGVNRWALVDNDGIFNTTLPKGGGKGPQLGFTIEDTAGCSCEQIISALDLGKGHEKHGCSISAMEAYVELVNP